MNTVTSIEKKTGDSLKQKASRFSTEQKNKRRLKNRMGQFETLKALKLNTLMKWA